MIENFRVKNLALKFSIMDGECFSILASFVIVNRRIYYYKLASRITDGLEIFSGFIQITAQPAT